MRLIKDHLPVWSWPAFYRYCPRLHLHTGEAVTDLAGEVEDTLFSVAGITAALPTVVSVDAIATFAITAVSSSVLTSLASDFLIGGTPTTTTTETTHILTITPLTTIRRHTITGIGTVWPPRSKRILPGVVITTDRLTE